MAEAEFDYGVIEQMSPLVRRVVARNPSPFTERGTGTFIIGRGRVALIDAGPDLADHVAALLSHLRGETIAHLFVTHTHMDHSPASAPVKRATGALTYGLGPHGAGGETSEAGADLDFVPDHAMRDGDVITGDGWTLEAVETPGHASSHICYGLREERTLFTGDHVMGWSTTVISPPDGNMGDYMQSLSKLLPRDDARYRPTHGAAIETPQAYVKALIDHRRKRHEAVQKALSQQGRSIPEIVREVYVGLDPRLVMAAGRSVQAHLLEMLKSGDARTDGAPGLDARYFPSS